ncbi:heavy metal translocating P-type ATPase, partial [Vibrio vulnificus]
TNGKPEVTDIVGDSQQVLKLAAALEESSEHPLATAILDKAKADNVQADKADSFQAIEGKGVEAIVNGQKAFVGNDKLLNDVKIS